MYYVTSSTSYFQCCEIDGVWRTFNWNLLLLSFFFLLLSYYLLFPTCLFVQGIVLCLANGIL